MKKTSHHSAVLAAVALTLIGCVEPLPVDPPPVAVDQGSCADVWGAVPDEGRLYVDAAAEEGGDGSYGGGELPTITAAIDLARSSGVRSIAIAAGEYPGSYVLSNDIAAWQDSLLELVGCGQGETVLTAISIPEGQPGEEIDVLQPILDIAGSETGGIVVRDLTARGGRRGIVVRSGAGSTAPILIQRVRVEDSVRIGILVDGPETVAHILDSVVEDTSSDDGAFGWGISVQTGAWLAASVVAPTLIEGTDVLGSLGVGIVSDGGWVDITASAVRGTAPTDGILGRGVQFQARSRGTIDGLVAEDNADTALYLLKPGREGEAIEVLNSSLLGTVGSEIPDSSQTSGDGLVVNQGGDTQLVTEFLVTLQDTEISGNDRAGVLVEDVVLQVGDSNSITADGTLYPITAQGDALVEGIGGGAPGVESGPDADELVTNDQTLLTDNLVE